MHVSHLHFLIKLSLFLWGSFKFCFLQSGVIIYWHFLKQWKYSAIFCQCLIQQLGIKNWKTGLIWMSKKEANNLEILLSWHNVLHLWTLPKRLIIWETSWDKDMFKTVRLIIQNLWIFIKTMEGRGRIQSETSDSGRNSWPVFVAILC